MIKISLPTRLAFFLFVGVCWAPALLVFSHFKSFEPSFLVNTTMYIPSLLQALGSTVLTLALAFLVAWGLLSWRHSLPTKLFLLLEYFILLPSFLPPLIVIVSVLAMFSQFPFGFLGVVLMHVIFEVGVVSVFLSRWMAYKSEPYNVLFQLHPQPWQRHWRLMFSLMATELWMAFGFLFVYFLTSLSVPMILSGKSFTSIELTMYQVVRNSQNWNLALHLYSLQILMVLPFLILLPKKSSPDEPASQVDTPVSAGGLGLGVLGMLPGILVFMGLVSQAPRGFWAAQREGLTTRLPLIGSLLVGLLSAGVAFLFLSGLVYLYQHQSFRKLMRLWIIPSFVMIGLLFESFVSSRSVMISFFWVSGTLVFLFAPTLARLGLFEQVEQTEPQIEMASLYGAGSWKIFSTITFPLAQPWIFILSGVCALWAMGDFAITRLFISEDVTLGLKIQSLIEQYRWDQAVVLSWILLGACSLVFLFFGGFAYVAAQKLK